MKDTLGEKIFYAANYAILAVIAASCLFPLLHIVSLSVSDSHAVASGRVSVWPVGFSFESYALLVKGSSIVSAFRNSVVITVVGVLLSMTFTVLAAYPLSRSYFVGRRPYTLAIVFTMIFSGGLIPTYLVYKELGLVNSYAAIWMMGLVSGFNMLIMKTFFENLPDELDDAARIDGCGDWLFLLRIVLPLSTPVLAALSLFYGVHYWNSFFHLLIYVHDTSKYNLMVLVQKMIESQSLLSELNSEAQVEDQAAALTPESIKAAGIIVMVVPMLMVYPFVQKYFVKGVMLGAIKG